MPPSSELDEFLADDESVVRQGPGILVDGSHRLDGVVGVTDRRVLFLSDEGRFVDVAHDAVGSIRSRPSATFTDRGLACRLVLALGALLAAFAFVAVFVLEPGVPVLALASVAVGGTVAAEYVRRYGVERSVPDGVVELLRAGSGDRGALRRNWGRTELDGDRESPDVGREPLVVGCVVVALFALIGLIVLTGSLLVIPLTFVVLGGIALVDRADRWRRALDEIGDSRRHERAVSIHLVSGRTVRLRIDAARRFDREISGLVRETRRDATDAGPARS